MHSVDDLTRVVMDMLSGNPSLKREARTMPRSYWTKLANHTATIQPIQARAAEMARAFVEGTI